MGSSPMSSPLELGAWNLNFASMLGSCFPFLGKFQVPDSKFPGSTPGNGQTIVFSRRPSELWNLELGTWSLDVAASQSKFQTPLGPTADSKFPGPTSRRAPRNKASSKRPLSLERGQVPRFPKFQRPCKFPAQRTVMLMAQGGVRT